MVLYTCIRKKDTNFYTCQKGFYEYEESTLLDYKVISVPSSDLTFEVLQNILDFELLKQFFPKEYQKNLQLIL
jgi:hypothetical protein